MKKQIHTENIDYNNISERDKRIVIEIIDLLRERQNVPISIIIEEFSIKFKIKEIPMKRIEDSLWHQFTKDEKLGQSIQGFKEIVEDNKKIRIPYVAFGADLDCLDKMINNIIDKSSKVKKT